MPAAAAAAQAVSSSRQPSTKGEASEIGLDDLGNGDGAEQIPETLPFQTNLRELYQTSWVQITVAALIFGNFIIEAADKQVNANEGTPAWDIFYGFEIFFATVFGVELVWNMYGNWLSHFWKSNADRIVCALLTGRAWNVFDFVIVAITVVSMISSDLPGISVLRLFRAFRVFRLFKRVESLKIIIEGVGASMPGVSNAFMILGILMGIWSIIGVEFFREYADEEFGNFLKAMFTMWQVMTMDSWASGIARPLLYDAGQVVAAPFFVSFTFVAGIVMTNVVVAILLEKYLGATTDAEEAKAKSKQAKRSEVAKQRQSARASSSRVAPEEEAANDRDRKLEKEDLIEMVLQTITRKNLTSLAKDDVISIALLLWHHPSLHEYVPEEMKVGWRVSPENQSRSILLNLMQRGITPSTDLVSSRQAHGLLPPPSAVGGQASSARPTATASSGHRPEQEE